MLYPAHAAAVLAIARLHNLLTITSLALVLCSTALTELLPPMDFPRPTGPHGVGRLSVELVDRSRAGWLVGDDGPRRVPVDVYYPAQPTPRLSASARWCGWVPKAILGPLVRNFKLPPFLFNHLAATQTWAREAVPPVQPAAGGSWRLVLFSHSLTGVRFQNSALCAELASHGCVVAAVEHPYEAMLSLFADGTVAPYRFVSHLPPGLTPAGLLAFREQCVAYRADDLALGLIMNAEACGSIGTEEGEVGVAFAWRAKHQLLSLVLMCCYQLFLVLGVQGTLQEETLQARKLGFLQQEWFCAMRDASNQLQENLYTPQNTLEMRLYELISFRGLGRMRRILTEVKNADGSFCVSPCVCSGWYGVSCTAGTGNVRSINLPSGGLRKPTSPNDPNGGGLTSRNPTHVWTDEEQQGTLMQRSAPRRKVLAGSARCARQTGIWPIQHTISSIGRSTKT